MGINQFSDMSKEEFKTYIGKLQVPKFSTQKPQQINIRDPNPNIDWTALGKVTRVKDQGQ